MTPSCDPAGVADAGPVCAPSSTQRACCGLEGSRTCAPGQRLSVRRYSVLRMRTSSVPAPIVDCEARAVAARLRAVRQASAITQAELARRLGTTQSAVARLEAGQQRLNLATIRRVAEALNCDATLVIRERSTA